MGLVDIVSSTGLFRNDSYKNNIRGRREAIRRERDVTWGATYVGAMQSEAPPMYFSRLVDRNLRCLGYWKLLQVFLVEILISAYLSLRQTPKLIPHHSFMRAELWVN
jgi:hypothetical protein